MAFIILQQILIMALYMLVGFFLYKGGKISDEGSRSLANMMAYAVMPAMLVNSFLEPFSTEKLAEFGWSFLLGTGTVVLSIVIASLIFRRSAIESFAAAFSNAGFIGIPLIRASIGEEGVFFLVGLLVPFNVIQWVYGCPKLAAEGRGAKGAHGPKEGFVQKVLLSPMVLSSLAGFLIFVSGLGDRLPVILVSGISGVASLNAPMAMIILGVYLARSDIRALFSEKRLYLVSAVRLLLIPCILIAVFALIPVDSRIKMTMVIAGSAPVGANVALYSQIYDTDYVYACKLVTQSTILSIAVMPFVVFLASFLIPV